MELVKLDTYVINLDNVAYFEHEPNRLIVHYCAGFGQGTLLQILDGDLAERLWNFVIKHPKIQSTF